MNVLELFSGTGSIGKVCQKLGWNAISVDLELPATHECDIMDFDYKQYPKDYFSIVWASPPCTNYSALKKCWYGKKLKDGTIYSKEQNIIDQNEADKLVLKSIEEYVGIISTNIKREHDTKSILNSLRNKEESIITLE